MKIRKVKNEGYHGERDKEGYGEKNRINRKSGRKKET
jgi:hypothetical protein